MILFKHECSFHRLYYLPTHYTLKKRLLKDLETCIPKELIMAKVFQTLKNFNREATFIDFLSEVKSADYMALRPFQYNDSLIATDR